MDDIAVSLLCLFGSLCEGWISDYVVGFVVGSEVNTRVASGEFWSKPERLYFHVPAKRFSYKKIVKVLANLSL